MNGKAYKKRRNKALKKEMIIEAISKIDESKDYEVNMSGRIIKLKGSDMKQFMAQKYHYYYK